MKKMTERHLINAFGGESQAHMRYLHFADRARKEKLPNISRLFKAIAHAEFIHAGDHYAELGHLDGDFVVNSMAAFGPGVARARLIQGWAKMSFYPGVYGKLAGQAVLAVNQRHIQGCSL